MEPNGPSQRLVALLYTGRKEEWRGGGGGTLTISGIYRVAYKMQKYLQTSIISFYSNKQNTEALISMYLAMFMALYSVVDILYNIHNLIE